MDSVKWMMGKDPLDTYMDQHEKDVQQQLVANTPLDSRLIRRFEELYSREAIDRANQMLVDLYSLSMPRFMFIWFTDSRIMSISTQHGLRSYKTSTTSVNH